MARTPIEERPATAQWLIRARDSQGWTADRFLEQLAEAGVKAPHRSNYAQWESGKVTPEPASLEPILAFYGELGVEPPSAAPAPEPAPDLATALLALARELEASRLDRQRMQGEIEGLQNLVGQLAAQLQLEQALSARIARHVQLETTGSAR